MTMKEFLQKYTGELDARGEFEYQNSDITEIDPSD